MVSLFWKKRKKEGGVKPKAVKEKEVVKRLEEKDSLAPASIGVSVKNFDWLVLEKPHFTEKSLKDSSMGKYTFVVKRKANKSLVRNAVENLYKVDVERVNLINIHAKARRLGRTKGFKSGIKKAIITLKQGQKIDIYPTQ